MTAQKSLPGSELLRCVKHGAGCLPHSSLLRGVPCTSQVNTRGRASERLGDLQSLERLPECLSTPPPTSPNKARLSKVPLFQRNKRQSHGVLKSDVLGPSSSEVAAGVTSPPEGFLSG